MLLLAKLPDRDDDDDAQLARIDEAVAEIRAVVGELKPQIAQLLERFGRIEGAVDFVIELKKEKGKKST